MSEVNTSGRSTKALLKRIAPVVGIVILFAAISLAYFTPAVFEGRDLFQQDVAGASGTAQDVSRYQDETGDVSYWTNSLFGGMPMYQIAPVYPSNKVLIYLQNVMTLKAPFNILAGYSWLLFAMMLGCYIMMRAMNIRRMASVIGAVMWTFSSYFIILIVAGHIWKLTALCFIPPTIGGLILTYRGKYWLGGICTAFFTALQIFANHIQMSYYFFFLMLFIVIGYLVEAIRQQRLAQFAKATAIVAVAGLLGVAVNLTSLYHTYQYSKQTMRGGSELTLKKDQGEQAEVHENSKGLDKAYITQWSYGRGETWTLLVPNIKGGATGYLGNEPELLTKVPGEYREIMAQMNTYWGDQPFTAGPVYVGAFVLCLFVLGCFVVKGPIKWALIAGTLFSILLSWGHNLMWLTDFFIDHVPMYDKFRTVSSILVVAELTIPVLAVLGLVEFMRNPRQVLANKVAVGVSLGVTMGLALLFAAMPSLFFNFLSQQEAQFFAQASAQQAADVSGIVGALKSVRIGVMRADALRSFFIILIGAVLLYVYAQGKLKAIPTLALVGVLVLVDLWTVDKRYLNDAQFIDTSIIKAKATPVTDADRAIAEDKDPHYRVFNLTVSPFNDATTSYMHRSIGGYHPAKLQRYQDLIEYQLAKQNQQVLDMLDTRYIIVPDQKTGQPSVVKNPYAYGAAWFVDNILWVDNANAEMLALDSTDLRHVAVVDKRWATPSLQALKPAASDSTDFVRLTKYTPNRAEYALQASQPRVVVFSEIYYPDSWQVTIDGKPAELFRANYVLRAMEVPAGKHEVKMYFDPTSIHVTERIATVALILLLLAVLAYGGWGIYGYIRKNKTTI